MQRHAMLMYTSCGWFFDEISGIETVQVIMYAGRTIQLAQESIRDHGSRVPRNNCSPRNEQPARITRRAEISTRSL